jgi:hypothetical protein
MERLAANLQNRADPRCRPSRFQPVGARINGRKAFRECAKTGKLCDSLARNDAACLDICHAAAMRYLIDRTPAGNRHVKIALNRLNC